MKHGISLDGSSLIKSHRVKFIRTTTVELTEISIFHTMKFTHPLRSPRTRQWEPKSHTDEISSDRKNQTVRSQELHGWDLLRSPRTEFKNPTVNGRIWKSVDVPRSSRKSFTPCSRKNTNVETVYTMQCRQHFTACSRATKPQHQRRCFPSRNCETEPSFWKYGYEASVANQT